MWIFEILIFIATILSTSYFWRWMRFLHLTRKIPKSSYDTSFRAAWRYFNADTKTLYREVSKAFGVSGLTKTWLGPIAIVNVTTPDDAKIVLNSKECLDKPYFVQLFGFPQGSLFGDIQSWRSHRKIRDPFFGVRSLRSLIPKFNSKVHALIETFETKKGEFDVLHSMVALTLEIALSTMDLDIDVLNMAERERDVYVYSLETYAETFVLRAFKFWLHPEKLFRLSSVSQRQERARKTFERLTREIIGKALKKVSIRETENPTFVRALMDPRNELSHSEISDEINSMILAAQDTSAVAMSSTMLLLAMHKDTQDKVVDELRQILGAWSENLYLDVEKLNQLKYTDMVINEVMRFMPVAPLVFRTNDREIVSSEGFVIPAKSNLLIPIFHIHRSRAFWGDDADEFKPERFERENFCKIHPYAFLAFAKGQRMCIGWRYATFLMKILLANVLLKYKLDTSLKLSELEYKMNVTLNVCQGYKITLTERNRDSKD